MSNILLDLDNISKNPNSINSHVGVAKIEFTNDSKLEILLDQEELDSFYEINWKSSDGFITIYHKDKTYTIHCAHVSFIMIQKFP